MTAYLLTSTKLRKNDVKLNDVTRPAAMSLSEAKRRPQNLLLF